MAGPGAPAGEDEAVDVGRVGGPDQRAEVPGVLDAVGDEDQGLVGEPERLRRPHGQPGDRDESVGTGLAGQPGEQLLRDAVHLGGAFRDPVYGVRRTGLGAPEEGVDRRLGREQAVVFPTAFDHDPAGRCVLADGEQVTDTGVLRTDGARVMHGHVQSSERRESASAPGALCGPTPALRSPAVMADRDGVVWTRSTWTASAKDSLHVSDGRHPYAPTVTRFSTGCR